MPLASNAKIDQGFPEESYRSLVSQFPMDMDVALGNIPGVISGSKYGYSRGLTTVIDIATPSTWTDLWAYSGQRTSPTTTFTPYVASSSGSDTAKTVVFTYLDTAGEEMTVPVTLNGQTPVSLGITAQELFTGENTGASDLLGNVAVATTNNFTSGVPDNQNEVLVQMPVNDGRSQVLARRVPSNKQCVFGDCSLTLVRNNGSAASAELSLDVRKSGGVWQSRRPIGISTSEGFCENLSDIVLGPLSDFRVRIRDISDNTCIINGVVKYYFKNV